MRQWNSFDLVVLAATSLGGIYIGGAIGDFFGGNYCIKIGVFLGICLAFYLRLMNTVVK